MEKKFEVVPSFNFIYEIGRPTGEKIRKYLKLIIITVLIYIVFNIGYNYIVSNDLAKIEISKPLINTIIFILIAIVTVILMLTVLFQFLQYKNTKYIFCGDRVIYEDNFLNKQKKTIMYSNIKEIEIRKKIWDRINNQGVIIIYTNAEKKFSSGLILYSIKNTEEVYNRINEIVYKNGDKDVYATNEKVIVENEVSNVNSEEINRYVEEKEKAEEDFRNDINKI